MWDTLVLYFDVNSAFSRGAAPGEKQISTQVTSLNLLPILNGQIKAGADDWAVEGKGGTGRGKAMEEEEVEGRWSKTTWPGGAASSKGSQS